MNIHQSTHLLVPNHSHEGVYHREGKRGVVPFCDWLVRILLPPVTVDPFPSRAISLYMTMQNLNATGTS
ncbi:hypothetical protein Y032_0846g2655 [Ancylostoma ceylanicum]|uniref:Uncharacterized protein n=1 Tax=Ancylostoma ceylanicum TaxID=53326 RepID=A0A016WB87_9BILA|nr:hypothetical protein Y032_0846g2655 [Ancylostoma ceylanicum]